MSFGIVLIVFTQFSQICSFAIGLPSGPGIAFMYSRIVFHPTTRSLFALISIGREPRAVR